MDKVPKGKLAAKLGLHCQYIPPIEEAFNSLQKFLQEEFPKLIEDINLSSTSTSNCLVNGNDDEALNVDDNDTCGSFSTLPVCQFFKSILCAWGIPCQTCHYLSKKILDVKYEL